MLDAKSKRLPSTMPSTLLAKTVVRGYHVYNKVLWEPQVGKTFIVVHETGNEHDRHAMAVTWHEHVGRSWCDHGHYYYALSQF